MGEPYIPPGLLICLFVLATNPWCDTAEYWTLMRLTSSLAPTFSGKGPRKKCCLSNVPMLYTATSAVASSLYLSELSGRKESGLRYAAEKNYCTKNYQLARHVLENGLVALQVSLDDIWVELFARKHQQFMQLFWSKNLNNAFCFFWKAMGLAYATPPFSLLAKVLPKLLMREEGWSCVPLTGVVQANTPIGVNC